MMRISDGLDLYNYRNRKKNLAAGREAHYNSMKAVGLGMLMYPDAKYRSIVVMMSNIVNQKTVSVKIEMIPLICETLGIDANFLFGFESKHDKDFKAMQEEKTE